MTEYEVEVVEGKEFKPAIDSEKNFHVELNLGLALPFKYQVSSHEKNAEHSATVTTLDDEDNLYMLKVTTQSPMGPLQSVEFDVIVALTSLLLDRNDPSIVEEYSGTNGVRVYFTYAQLCKILGIKADSTTRVKKAIENIKSQTLKFKKMKFMADDKRSFKSDSEETKIILKSGDVQKGDKYNDMQRAQKYQWVEFDRGIINNLAQDYVSVMAKKDYLSLESGHQRRTYVFLAAKKLVFGKTFTFSLNELANVLGLSENNKRRRQIGEFLEKIKERTDLDSYIISKKKLGRNEKEDWDINVTFGEDEVVIIDDFWKELVEYYGEKNLRLIDITEIDVINFRREFENRYQKAKGTTKINYIGKEYSVGEYCIDITLWQILKCNYSLTSGIKPLANKLMDCIIEDNLSIPDKYRHFITERNYQKRKELSLKQIDDYNLEKERNKKEEENKISAHFESHYKILIQNENMDSFLKEYAQRALQEDGTKPQLLMEFPELISIKQKELARDLFDKLLINEDISVLRKRFLNGEESQKNLLN